MGEATEILFTENFLIRCYKCDILCHMSNKGGVVIKRILSIILAFALLLTALCVPALAEEVKPPKPLSEMTLPERVTYEATTAFQTAQVNAQRESFHGYCGLLVGHLLFALKVNKYYIANDGNKWYNYYKERKTTTGGHSISAYDSVDYTLEEALLAACDEGRRTARNILVGFDKTDTTAGQEYGHALVVNAIIDGKVYFTESFDLWLNGRMRMEGEVIVCSIADFATYFDRWAEFEGLIHFGSGSLEEVSPMKQTNLWLTARFEATIRTQPCVIGEKRCQLIRTVRAGERLRASGVFRGDRGMFYRVETEDGYGFIPAVSVFVEDLNHEDITIEGVQLPKSMQPGTTPQVGGTVTTRLTELVSMELSIYNEDGRRVARNRMVCQDNKATIQKLVRNGVLEKLKDGAYRVEIVADHNYYLAQELDMVFHRETVTVYEDMLVVGATEGKVSYLLPQPKNHPEDGWFRQDGKWYFYEDGAPRQGWLSVMDTMYYLDETGAAVTGWQFIGNNMRYFDPEGAMRTNEKRTNGKNIYEIDENGVAWFTGEVKPSKKKK